MLSARENVRRSLVIVLMLAVFSASLCAQESPVGLPAVPPVEYSRKQALLVGGIPYACFYAGALSLALLPKPYAFYTLGGLTLAGMVPYAVVDPAAGLGRMGMSALALGAGIGLSYIPELYGDDSLSSLAQNIALKNSMWSYYEGYAKVRSRAKPGEYADAYTPSTFPELFAAPYDLNNLRRLSVWLPLILCDGSLIAFNALGGDDEAVWTTGKGFIGSTEVPILLGLLATAGVSALSNTFTGIGEESVFRGIGYEEMKLSLGILPAKAVDSLLFAAVHVPQEIAAKQKLGNIALLFAFRSMCTLGLQWAYDDGGLKASVAQHAWINIISDIASYLFFAGVSNEKALSVSVDLAFTLP